VQAGERAGMNKISVVVPAYNEAENLPVIKEKLARILEPYGDFEVLFVDDGSRDRSLEVLRGFYDADPRFTYLSLVRNFGHQSALKAGLDAAVGDCVIMLDADLQHPPELIPQMIERWQQGSEVVNMIRRGERTSAFKRLTSASFYRLVNAISDYEIRPGASDFRLLDRKVVDAIIGLGERTLFLRGLIPWLGFRHCDIDYVPDDRLHGSSQYSLRRMLSLAVDGITASSIRPLRLSTVLGVTMSVLAMIYVVYALAIKLFVGTAISGWTSLLVGVMLMGGVQLMILGILGEYLGKVLIEIKGRPNYIVREKGQARAPRASAGLRTVAAERKAQ
jgi:polyisoprenyl-phosphate glycosyltransferase